jgi:hypothetical protein
MIELCKVGSYKRRDDRSNCARGCGTQRWPRQTVLGIDRGFVIEGKADGHDNSDRGYALAGPLVDL